MVGDDDVLSVATGPGGAVRMRKGGIIVVHSTVHPDTCVKPAAEAAERGVSVVDAPVSGGGRAEAGTLLVMVGGDDEPVATCPPVFHTLRRSGGASRSARPGQVTKLLNNVLFTANLATAADTPAFGKSSASTPPGWRR